jgi:hypothetical protein
MNSKNFALIGASGYIAPRHMRAIKETGNKLVVTLDQYDGIGVIDRYFPEASFFTEFERFDRFIDKCRRDTNNKIHFISICSPNYLHDAHIRFALKSGADAICEKPLVLNPCIDGEEIEFSGGFTDLHTRSYEEILNGNGFGLDEAYGSIGIVSTIRNLEPIGLKGEYQPFYKSAK